MKTKVEVYWFDKNGNSELHMKAILKKGSVLDMKDQASLRKKLDIKSKNAVVVIHDDKATYCPAVE